MKTFIASLTASFDVIESDDLNGVSTPIGKAAHCVYQFEAETQEAAEQKAMAEAQRVMPEGQGYFAHSASVKQLEITPGLCAQIAELAASLASEEFEKGQAVLAAMPAMPHALSDSFSQGVDVMTSLAANLAGLTYPQLDFAAIFQQAIIYSPPQHLANAGDVCKTRLKVAEE